MASVWWASGLIEPSDIAPVLKRLTISLTGSTSSTGTGGRTPSFSWNSPRRVPARSDSASTVEVYCWKTSYFWARVECCSWKTVCGLNRCTSPSRRHWYSPPVSSLRCARSVALSG